MDFDVFLSHASSDKETFVRPLAARLRDFGVRVWYDETVLRPGMSLREAIDKGLTRSEHCVLVISKEFLARGWPRWELNGVVQRRLESQQTKIIPVWLDVSSTDVRAHSPSLSDIVALRAEAGVDAVALQIRTLVLPPDDTVRNAVLQIAIESLAEIFRSSWRRLRYITLAIRSDNHLIHRAADVAIAPDGSFYRPSVNYLSTAEAEQYDVRAVAMPIVGTRSEAPIGVLMFVYSDRLLSKRRQREASAAVRLLAPIIEGQASL